MDNLTNELRRLREADPDVALVLDVFGNLDRVYNEALEAMGASRKQTPLIVTNSADITISIESSSSASVAR